MTIKELNDSVIHNWYGCYVTEIERKTVLDTRECSEEEYNNFVFLAGDRKIRKIWCLVDNDTVVFKVVISENPTKREFELNKFID